MTTHLSNYKKTEKEHQNSLFNVHRKKKIWNEAALIQLINLTDPGSVSSLVLILNQVHIQLV